MDVSYFVIFCIIPILIINYLSKKPQEEFIRLYQEKVNKNDFLLPSEYIKKYRHNPIDQLKDAPRMLNSRFEVFWKDYHDKELNNSARKVKYYFIAQVVVIVLNFFVIAYFIRNS